MTKEQLRAYRSIKLERDKLKEMLEEFEATMYDPATQKLSSQPRGGSGVSDPTGSAAQKHKRLITQFEKKVSELDDAMLEIEKAIEPLRPTERTLIRLYYMQGQTWEEVCVSMSYSWSQIHRIHAGVLDKLAKSEEQRKAND